MERIFIGRWGIGKNTECRNVLKQEIATNTMIVFFLQGKEK